MNEFWIGIAIGFVFAWAGSAYNFHVYERTLQMIGESKGVERLGPCFYRIIPESTANRWERAYNEAQRGGRS